MLSVPSTVVSSPGYTVPILTATVPTARPLALVTTNRASGWSLRLPVLVSDPRDWRHAGEARRDRRANGHGGPQAAGNVDDDGQGLSGDLVEGDGPGAFCLSLFLDDQAGDVLAGGGALGDRDGEAQLLTTSGAEADGPGRVGEPGGDAAAGLALQPGAEAAVDNGVDVGGVGVGLLPASAAGVGQGHGEPVRGARRDAHGKVGCGGADGGDIDLC